MNSFIICTPSINAVFKMDPRCIMQTIFAFLGLWILALFISYFSNTACFHTG